MATWQTVLVVLVGLLVFVVVIFTVVAVASGMLRPETRGRLRQPRQDRRRRL